MYINNIKKLFKDLKSIDVLRSYMEALEDDNEITFSNLLSVIDDNLDKAFSVESLTWEYETEEEKKELERDYKKVKEIRIILTRELNSKYKLICPKCKEVFYYLKKPKGKQGEYFCPKCKTELKIERI